MELSILFLVVTFAVLLGSRQFFARPGNASQPHTATHKPFGWFSLVTSVVATQIGASTILYTAECAFYDGIFAILYPLGTTLGLLVLGLGVGARIQKLQLSCISDLFDKYYGSHTLKKVASVLTLVSLLGLLIAHAAALRDFLHILGVEQELFFIVCWVVIVSTNVRSGLTVVMKSEMIQALILIALLGGAYFYSPQAVSLFNSVEGFRESGFEGVDAKLTAYLLMPCFFVFFEPETIKASLATRSKREMSAAILISGIILIVVSFIPVYYSLVGKASGMAETTSGFVNVIGSATNQSFAMLCAGILLLVLVTGSSSILRSLAACVKGSFHTQKNSIKLSWGWSFALGMSVLFFSYGAESLANIILNSYSIMVVCLLVPLVQAAFSRKPKEFPKGAAALSMLFGGIGFSACRILDINFLPEVFSIALSWIGFMIGTVYSKESEPLVFPKKKPEPIAGFLPRNKAVMYTKGYTQRKKQHDTHAHRSGCYEQARASSRRL
jgi:SSS family solute:Na+ symporter